MGWWFLYGVITTTSTYFPKDRLVFILWLQLDAFLLETTHYLKRLEFSMQWKLQVYIYLSPLYPIISSNGYYGCFPHILRPIHSYISQPNILGQFPAHSLKADFVTYSASIRLCESLGCVLQQKWAAGILKPCSWLLRRWQASYFLSLADTFAHFCTHYMCV